MQMVAWGLAAWCLGILAPLTLPPVMPALLALGVTLLAVTYRKLTPRYRNALAMLLLLLGSMLWSHHVHPHPGVNDLSAHAPMRWVKLKGRVVTDPVPTTRGQRFELEVAQLMAPFPASASGKILVRLSGTASASYGETLLLEGGLHLPAIAANPGEFSYRDYLERRGIFVTLNATSCRHLAPASWSLVGLAIRLKSACLAQINRHMPPREATLLGSLLLGSGVSPVDPEVADRFRDLGLAHVLAVSGAQILILLQALKQLLGWLRIKRRYGLLLAGGILLLYGLMTGLPPSIVRAMVMASATLVAWTMRRRARKLLPLLLACWLMLIVRPLWLFDLGFLFSAIATFALQYAAPIISERMKFLPPWLAGALSTSIAALLWVSPLQLATFGQYSAWALVANLFAVLFVEALTLGGALLVPLGAILDHVPLAQSGATLGYTIAGCLLQAFQLGVQWLHQLPGASLHMKPLSTLACACLYALLAVGFEGARRHLPGLPLAACLAAGLLILLSSTPKAAGLRVVMLSVGQGDAILIQTPGNRWFLVDAGSAWEGGDTGERTIVPFLRREGVQKLAGVILTHPHADHVGGASSVLAAMPVEGVWDGGQVFKDPRYHRVFQTMLERQIPWSNLQEGTVAQLEPDLRLEVLGPPASRFRGTHSDLNCNSLVFRLRYRHFAMLFAGDLEQEAEMSLARRYPGGLAADVLKVSHHGSRFGSVWPFLQAVHPRLSMVSVGEHNSFRHPSAEALARLGRFGPVLRTDRNGGLELETDGQSWTVHPTLFPAGSVYYKASCTL